MGRDCVRRCIRLAHQVSLETRDEELANQVRGGDKAIDALRAASRTGRPIIRAACGRRLV